MQKFHVVTNDAKDKELAVTKMLDNTSFLMEGNVREIYLVWIRKMCQKTQTASLSLEEMGH